MAWTREKELEYLKKRQEEIDSLWERYGETAREQSRWRLRDDAFSSREWQDKDLELGKRAEYEYDSLRERISGAADYNRRQMRPLFFGQLSSMLDAGFLSEVSREERCALLLVKKETPFPVLCTALNLTEERVCEIAAETGVDPKDLPAQLKATLGDEYRIRRRPWLESDCATSEELRQSKSMKIAAESAAKPEDLRQSFENRYAGIEKSLAAETVVYDAGAGDRPDAFSAQTLCPERFRVTVARQVCKAIKLSVLYLRFAAFDHFERDFLSSMITRELAGLRTLSVLLIAELTEHSNMPGRLLARLSALRDLGVPEKIRQTLRRPDDGTDVSGMEKRERVTEWTLTLPETFAELERLAGMNVQQ
ncbi:MAG: hypothetical protein IKT07_08455 [Oscillospiraceae bacterium]|nr:hypothetical protein [Oscillospiraceae bacterium]